MNNNFKNFDGIILYGVPKGQGLHGLTPEPLPVAQLTPKEKLIENNNNKPILKLSIIAVSILLITKIFK